MGVPAGLAGRVANLVLIPGLMLLTACSARSKRVKAADTIFEKFAETYRCEMKRKGDFAAEFGGDGCGKGSHFARSRENDGRTVETSDGKQLPAGYFSFATAQERLQCEVAKLMTYREWFKLCESLGAYPFEMGGDSDHRQNFRLQFMLPEADVGSPFDCAVSVMGPPSRCMQLGM